MQPQKHDLQPHNTLEPCRARIVPISDSQVVPTNNKEYERSPVIRGKTAASSGAKPVARAQPMNNMFPGCILPSVLLQQSSTDCID